MWRCWDAASGIYDVAANSPNMATVTSYTKPLQDALISEHEIANANCIYLLWNTLFFMKFLLG